MVRFPLTSIVSRAQQLLGEVLTAGDLAVDLTAGGGRDTLFLARRVGPEGRVLSFDIQQEALTRSAGLLTDAGLSPVFHRAPPASPLSSGVHLIHDCHSRLEDYLDASPSAVIANLGFLPGGDKTLTTLPATTLAALGFALESLAPGGRLAVAVYLGHPGGVEEGGAVETLFRSLPPQDWQVLRLQVFNCATSPFLLIAEKRS
jgi:hypothetical protein